MALNTLLDLLRKMSELGTREAIKYNNSFRTFKYTYGELYRKIAGFSQLLENKGIGYGDRLLLWGNNSPEWIIAFWSAVARGIQVVPLDARYSLQFVQRITQETRPSLLIYEDGTDPYTMSIPGLSFLDIRETPQAEDLPMASISPQDILQIVYTSGTTAEPKGIVHRHENICADLRPLQEEILRYRWMLAPVQPLRILSLLPLSHMFGQALGLFTPLLLHGSAMFMRELNPRAIVENIRREKITALVAVPRIIEQLRDYAHGNYPPPYPKQSTEPGRTLKRIFRYRRLHRHLGWKFWVIVAGGAQLQTDVERWWINAGFLVVQGYGLTEASPIVAVNHPFKTKQGSLGKAMRGQEIKIAPDGEILVRGDNVVTEFLGPDGESVSTPKKWLHTGDIGEIDQNGRLYFKGRKKDVIVTSEGLNVYPEDVEKELNKQAEIKESAVVSLQTDNQPLVHAVIIPQAEAEKMQEAVQRANANLEIHQKIKGFSIWPDNDFPRTESTQKIKRREVRKWAQGGEGAKPQTGNGMARLYSILAQISGHAAENITDQMRLKEDLGLGSLDRVELTATLESYFDLDLEDVVAGAFKVAELRQALLTGHEGHQQHTHGDKHDPDKRADTWTIPGKADKEGFKGLPDWNRKWPAECVRLLFHNLLLLPGFNLYMSFEVAGRKNLQQIRPPVIFAANHSSHLDTLALLAALPPAWRRRLAPAMGTQHFQPLFQPDKYPWRKILSARLQYNLACLLFNAYPLAQSTRGLRQTVKHAGVLVDRGYCPLIFPEGIRSEQEDLLPFRAGIGLLAVRLNVPVVPVYIHGLLQALPPGKKCPRKSRVKVSIGAPLNAQAKDDYASMTAKIEKRVAGLKNELQFVSNKVH